jgi:hypothetical protein
MANTTLNRRQLIKGLAAASAAVAGSNMAMPRWARAAANKDARFLIVIPAFGGGQIIDSVLPIRASEAGAQAPVVDCFADNEVVELAGSPIRTVDITLDHMVGQTVSPYTVALSPLVDKHKAQMMVTTLTGTSVNHAIAQHRSLTGNGAWSGRTMQEVVANAYGKDYPLPNVNMSRMGYLKPGDDPTVPSRVRAEPIVDPLLKPLSLSASKGLRAGGADIPAQSLIDQARALRNDKLDPESSFYQTFRLSERIQLWMRQRGVDAPEIEAQNLIDKLFFVPEIPDAVPLSEYGLVASEDALALAEVFPDIFADDPDPLERQAAMAYLLIKNHASVTVTLSPNFAPVLGGPFGVKTPPLAFDGSHNDHRASQALMWFQMLSIADRLIDLLKGAVFDPDTGETFWDRTMIHFATDFGRDKRRPSGEAIWGTSHHLNNGHLTISPLVNGNTVLGGVDPQTALTYGFNLQTGAPEPGRTTSEGESFAGLVQALGVDTSEAGLPDVPCMRA